MQKSNYALITALYSNGERGLYSDVYFPIIKYAIIKYFASRPLTEAFGRAEDIYNVIVDRFHIEIPQIVIVKSIEKIFNQRWGSVDGTLYEGGESFCIKRAFFANDDEDIDEKEKVFFAKMQRIENEYQSFIKREGLAEENISFNKFLAANTEEILGYFENKDLNSINEDYATLVFFFEYLHDNEKELYLAANQFFWGSIIAAFLCSNKPQVNDSADGLNDEYFIDTPIVMGVLKLSSQRREKNALDVCRIISSSGGTLRVHPMTIEEVCKIIQKVEQNGADPNTEIAEACKTYGYLTPDLAEIRTSIETKLSAHNISIFPNMSPDEKHKNIQKYKGSRLTTLLANNRSNNHTSYSNDGFREIHDIFMDAYISERRKKKGNSEHTFFLTSNRDLISFCREMHTGENNMKSMGKVILELWMHNAKPADISECAFAEKMACCLDFHNTRVSREIALVATYYNKTKDNFNQKVFEDFIAQLYRRAKNSILTADSDPYELASLGDDLGKRIQEAVEEDKKNYSEALANAAQENKMLSENLSVKEQEIVQANNLNKEQASRIESLTAEKQKEETMHEVTKTKLSDIEKACDAAIKEKESAEQIANLYRSKDSILKTLKDKRRDFTVYKTEREKSFKEVLPYTFFIIAGMLAIVLLVVIGLTLINGQNVLNINVGAIAALCVGAITIGNSIKGSNWYKDKKDVTYAQWDNDHNDVYNKTKLEIETLEVEFKEVERKLSESQPH